MEMRRYVRHSPAWWILEGILALLTAGCIVMGLLTQRNSADIEATPLGDEVWLDDYNYIDVQYMSTWIYKVTLNSGDRLTFYLAWDAEGYGYLVQMEDAEYARFADIVAYTYSNESDLLEATGQGDSTTSELAMYIPLTESAVPPAVRLTGMICETPSEYINDIVEGDGMTAEDLIYTYGDFYIDSGKTPVAGDNGWIYIAVLLATAAFIVLAVAECYSAQLRGTLKPLRKSGLLERAESEFHYLQGDLRSDALVSTAFLYGRRQNIVLPLADVLWIYRHDIKLL